MRIILAILMFLLVAVPILLLLVRWAQRRHLLDMMQSEGMLRRARGIRTAICLFTSEKQQWIEVELFLSNSRICAFRSLLHPPFIHVPFQDSALEITLAAGTDEQKRSYLGLGALAKQGEVRFFLPDAREWLCDIERLTNRCSPTTCENYDPAVCGECPIGAPQAATSAR
ncbi:MAG: hypothetical protein AB1489_37830 [Acidobacteriota bacterium]